MEQSGNQVTNLIYEALPESQNVRAALDNTNNHLTEKQQLDARSEFVLQKYRETAYLSESNLKKYVQCRYFPTLYGTVTQAFIQQARQDNMALLTLTTSPMLMGPMAVKDESSGCCRMQHDSSTASMSGASLASTVISEGEAHFVNNSLDSDNNESNTFHGEESDTNSNAEETEEGLVGIESSEDVAAVTSALSNRLLSTSRHNTKRRSSKSRKSMRVADISNTPKDPTNTRMRRPKSSNCIPTDASASTRVNNDLKNSQHRCSSSGDLNISGHGRRNTRMSYLASRRASVRDLGKAGSAHQRKSMRNFVSSTEEDKEKKMSGFAKRAASTKRRLRKSASMPVPDDDDSDDQQEPAHGSTAPTTRTSRSPQRSKSTDGHRNLLSGKPLSRIRQRGVSRDESKKGGHATDNPSGYTGTERQKSRSCLSADKEVHRRIPREGESTSLCRTRKLAQSEEAHCDSNDEISIGESSDEDEDNPNKSEGMDDNEVAAKIKSMVRNVGASSSDEPAVASTFRLSAFDKHRRKEVSPARRDSDGSPQTQQNRAPGTIAPTKRRSSAHSLMDDALLSDGEYEQKTPVTKIRAASAFLALAAEKRRIVQSAKVETCTPGASLP